MGVTARNAGGLKVEIDDGRHVFFADEPIDVGDDTGPTPYELLLGALGACTVMTVQMYARRKSWPLEAIEVRLENRKIHAQDCKDCESEPGSRVEEILLDLEFRGPLSGEQIDRLRQIAGKCPVHRTLTGEIKIRTNGAERRQDPSSGTT